MQRPGSLGEADDHEVGLEVRVLLDCERVGLIGHRVHREEFEDVGPVFATDQDPALAEA